MTAFGSLETAIEAIRQGAYDHLAKPFKLAGVTLAVQRAVDDQRLRLATLVQEGKFREGLYYRLALRPWTAPRVKWRSRRGRGGGCHA